MNGQQIAWAKKHFIMYACKGHKLFILHLHVSHVGDKTEKNTLSILLWAPALVGRQHRLAIPERLVASQELSVV